jgi:hypothetical protein
MQGDGGLILVLKAMGGQNGKMNVTADIQGIPGGTEIEKVSYYVGGSHNDQTAPHKEITPSSRLTNSICGPCMTLISFFEELEAWKRGSRSRASFLASPKPARGLSIFGRRVCHW